MARPPRLPPIHALTAFEAAARLGGFGPAADELCITPSAVSHRIRQLESMLGEPLFERSPNGVRLNPAGQRYLLGVREAFDKLANLHGGRNAEPARLRVGAPPTFARDLLIPALPGFYRQWPDIEIEVEIAAPLDDKPARHDIDVRWGNGHFDGRPATRLFEDDIVVVATPATVQARGLAQPADLARAELLRTRLLPWRVWFAAAGLDWPEPVRGPMFADLGILLESAASGLGVAACPRRIAARWIQAGQLVPLFGIAARSPLGYHLLMDVDQAQRPEAAAFAEWLASTLA